MSINNPEIQAAEIHEPIKLKVVTDVICNPPEGERPNTFIKTKYPWEWYATDRRIVYQTANGQADAPYENIIQIEKARYPLFGRVRVTVKSLPGSMAIVFGIIALLLILIGVFSGEEYVILGGIIIALFPVVLLIILPMWPRYKQIGICDCAILKTQIGPIILSGTENEINALFTIIREEKENIIKMTQVKEVQRQVIGSSTRTEEVHKAIEKLADLAASGYLTMEEFRKKKDELLKQI